MFSMSGCQATTATGDGRGSGDPPRLTHAAQLHADHLARAARLEHVLPGERHPRPADRLGAAGYKWKAWELKRRLVTSPLSDREALPYLVAYTACTGSTADSKQ